MDSTKNVFGDFLLTSGLYDEIEVTESNANQLVDLIGRKVKLDCYCPLCRTSRVFTLKPMVFRENDRLLVAETTVGIFKHRTPHFAGDEEPVFSWHDSAVTDSARVMKFEFICSMNYTHHLDYIVLSDGNTLRKIGQFPSVADLSFSEVNEYKKVMNNEDLSDLKRALGLHAHGIGAGSYVYLRRVIEKMIIEAKDAAVSDGVFSADDERLNCKIVDLIPLLKGYLPDLLLGNKSLYGILSKGIHELSEEECKSYFYVLYQGILMIATEKEEERKKKESEVAFSKAINSISSTLKNKE